VSEEAPKKKKKSSKKCWNCGERISRKASTCPECGTGQNIARTQGDDFDFKRPDEVIHGEETSPDTMFMNQERSKKKGETCPVCGTSMSYKDRVDSWYCPKCKNFF
jgi:predicted RNA-binding Zn-ribbon protein involved in translation (DUF1610 family)